MKQFKIGHGIYSLHIVVMNSYRIVRKSNDYLYLINDEFLRQLKNGNYVIEETLTRRHICTFTLHS